MESADRQDIAGSRSLLAVGRSSSVLTALSAAAYLSSLALPNFEACYYGCTTLAGYEFQFGQTVGSGLLTGAIVLAELSYWIAAIMLLRGFGWWWVLLAVAPYGAWYGYVGFMVLAIGRDFIDPMAGWWLWMAAPVLLAAAILAANRPISRW